jgi:hypothetical protein
MALESQKDGYYLDKRRVEDGEEIEAVINGEWVRGRFSRGTDYPTLRPMSGPFRGAPLPILDGAPCRRPA